MPGLKRPPKERTAQHASTIWQAAMEDCVSALAWSPDGRYLAAAAISGPITLFDGVTGQAHARLQGHTFGTTALSWWPQGKKLASSGQDGTVRLWDGETGEEQRALDAGASWVERVAWSPAGDMLAAAAGRTLRLWDATGQLLRDHADHPSTIADIQWRPGGRDLAAAVYGGVVLRHADQPDLVRRFSWKGSSLVLAWNPRGTYIATGEQDSTVHFWVVQTGRDLQMWGYETKALQLAWNHTGRYLATGGSASIVIWDCSGKGPEGTTPQTLKGHTAPISALAYQPIGPVLASGGQDGQVALWQMDQPRRVPLITQLESSITQLVWSSDNRRVAVSTEAGAVVVLGTP